MRRKQQIFPVILALTSDGDFSFPALEGRFFVPGPRGTERLSFCPNLVGRAVPDGARARKIVKIFLAPSLTGPRRPATQRPSSDPPSYSTRCGGRRGPPAARSGGGRSSERIPLCSSLSSSSGLSGGGVRRAHYLTGQECRPQRRRLEGCQGRTKEKLRFIFCISRRRARISLASLRYSISPATSDSSTVSTSS